ncbi:MAG: hypothetical protein HQL82_14165 [Magnetococcales bacterium]|nr:hypothetical protein [Magnetococcales bacterium]
MHNNLIRIPRAQPGIGGLASSRHTQLSDLVEESLGLLSLLMESMAWGDADEELVLSPTGELGLYLILEAVQQRLEGMRRVL